MTKSDVTSLATHLPNRQVKNGARAVSKAAVINSSGQRNGAAGTATDCVLRAPWFYAMAPAVVPSLM